MSIFNSPESRQREARLREILDELGIPQTHLNAVQLYNSHQPYHNWHHCIVVALNSYEAGISLNVTFEKLQVLVLAALYHDYDHTGDPAKADILNIVRAVQGSQFWLGVKGPKLSRSAKNEVATLIAATESSHARKPQTMLEEIIMDADLLATIGPDQQQWWAALSEELGVPCTAASTLTFLLSFECHSLWGIKRHAQAVKLLEDLTSGSESR